MSNTEHAVTIPIPDLMEASPDPGDSASIEKMPPPDEFIQKQPRR
jgi:hypothetical protein